MLSGAAGALWLQSVSSLPVQTRKRKGPAGNTSFLLQGEVTAGPAQPAGRILEGAEKGELSFLLVGGIKVLI